MEKTFQCPICTECDWGKSETYAYERGDFLSKFDSTNLREQHWAMRQHVLQNIWLPDEEHVKLTLVYCKNCGFVCYSPRPTEEDITTKYVYLNSFPHLNKPKTPSGRIAEIVDRRSRRLYQIAKKYVAQQSPVVLDYGGYDGRLLKHFVKHGCKSYLVDYKDKIIDGVEKIGSSVADIPENFRFDMIICSHVIEHVSDPVGLLHSFRPFLKDDGVLYVEVPMEVWKGIPIAHEPVTHVNFFTKDSLKAALLRSNYKIIHLETDIQPYDAKFKRVAWAVAGLQNGTNEIEFSSVKTKKLLKPGLLAKGRRAAENILLRYVLNKPSAKKN